MNKTEKILLFFVVIVSNCLGIAKLGIVRIKLGGRNTEFRLQTSRLANIWSSILMGIILYSNFFIPISSWLRWNHRNWAMIEYIKTLQMTLASLVLVILWIYSFLQQNFFLSIANKFMEIDHFFEKYRHTFPLSRFRNFFIPSIIILLILAIIEFVMENSVYAYYDVPLWYSWWRKYLFPHYVFTFFILQYAIVARSIRIRLKSLNNGLMRLTRASDDFSNKCTVAGKIITNKSILDTFVSIRKIHRKLYNLCGQISEYYSFPVLIVLAYTTFVMITLVYYMITLILYFHDGGVIEKVLPLFALSMAACLCGRLIHEIQQLIKEFKKTAPITFEILYSSSADHSLKAAVIYFTQELLHKQLTFTAYGLFPLDYTFFQSIFATSLTYSIIILQSSVPSRPNLTRFTNETN